MTRDLGQDRVRRETAATLRAFESAFADGAGSSGDPSVADFRAVGLCEADACRARSGMTAGMYLTFEDAAVAVSTFGAGAGTRLDPVALRERAAGFAPKAVAEGGGGSAVLSHEDRLRESLRGPMRAYYGSVSEASLDGRMTTLRSEAKRRERSLAEAVRREVEHLETSVAFQRGAPGKAKVSPAPRGSVVESSAEKPKAAGPDSSSISEADARAFLYGTTTTEGDQR